MAKETVIEIENINKQYPNDKIAVSSLSLSIQRGEVFGILGPNGSGKTTTILMLLGLTEPTNGKASILGMDPLRTPLEIKRRVGYMPDTVGFYEEMSGYENLDYSARFLSLSEEEREKRITDNLKKMGLSKSMHEKVRTYSHGMRRRLGLTEVLVKKPEIAILDEPTQGLDPESASEFLELISYLKQNENITILLASHLLNQVQEVCDRVGLFSEGRMVISGTVDELSQRIIGGKFSIILHAKGKDLYTLISAVDGVHSVEELAEGRFKVECVSDLRTVLAEKVHNSGGKLIELTIHRHTLDAIYKTYFKEVFHAHGSA